MTKQLFVGGVAVGGGAPVSIQSMCNTKTDDVAATVAQIRQLEAAGCEIVRVAIPDQAAAEAIDKIKEQKETCLDIRYPDIRPICPAWQSGYCHRDGRCPEETDSRQI